MKKGLLFKEEEKTSPSSLYNYNTIMQEKHNKGFLRIQMNRCNKIKELNQSNDKLIISDNNK